VEERRSTAGQPLDRRVSGRARRLAGAFVPRARDVLAPERELAPGQMDADRRAQLARGDAEQDRARDRGAELRVVRERALDQAQMGQVSIPPSLGVRTSSV
jgi:protein involved in polysaccharide export with SLBB domain